MDYPNISLEDFRAKVNAYAVESDLKPQPLLEEVFKKAPKPEYVSERNAPVRFEGGVHSVGFCQVRPDRSQMIVGEWDGRKGEAEIFD